MDEDKKVHVDEMHHVQLFTVCKFDHLYYCCISITNSDTLADQWWPNVNTGKITGISFLTQLVTEVAEGFISVEATRGLDMLRTSTIPMHLNTLADEHAPYLGPTTGKFHSNSLQRCATT